MLFGPGHWAARQNHPQRRQTDFALSSIIPPAANPSGPRYRVVDHRPYPLRREWHRVSGGATRVCCDVGHGANEPKRATLFSS